MKRGFEENIPRVRPRVRLGRALDEGGAEVDDAAPEDTPQLELASPPEPAATQPAQESMAAAAHSSPAQPETWRGDPAPPRKWRSSRRT